MNVSDVKAHTLPPPPPPPLRCTWAAVASECSGKSRATLTFVYVVTRVRRAAVLSNSRIAQMISENKNARQWDERWTTNWGDGRPTRRDMRLTQSNQLCGVSETSHVRSNPNSDRANRAKPEANRLLLLLRLLIAALFLAIATPRRHINRCKLQFTLRCDFNDELIVIVSSKEADCRPSGYFIGSNFIDARFQEKSDTSLGKTKIYKTKKKRDLTSVFDNLCFGF